MSRGANGCRSSSASMGTRWISGLDMLGDDRCRDPAARRERAGDAHPPWAARRDQIVENPVGRRLVEDALVAIAGQIELEGFQFDAGPVGYITDVNLSEIGQAGLRTDRRELRAANLNFVLSLGPG